MNTTQTKVQAIIEQIENMKTDELINLNNIYCSEANYHDDEIYVNDDDFFNTFFQNDVIGAVRATTYGNYSYGHKYVKFNGYGNLESFDFFYVDELIESPEKIAKFCIEEQNDLNGLIELPEEE